MYLGDMVSCAGLVLIGMGILSAVFFLATKRRRHDRIERMMRERY